LAQAEKLHRQCESNARPAAQGVPRDMLR
jgi:hypothetical protein